MNYTILFALVSLFISFFYILQKKTLLMGDGLEQHITALAYFGKYLRHFLHLIFIDHTFQIPQWDFTMGVGGDIFTTLHWYVIGEPITLLSVFVPVDHADILYQALIFARLYLIGLSFIIFCRYKSFDDLSILCGSIVYAFCGYALAIGFRHPYFMMTLIYLPMLCLGLEKIFDGKKPFFFTFFVFVTCVSNFYFFYIQTIFVFIYAITRFAFLEKSQKNAKNFFRLFLTTFAAYLCGTLMACILFIPNISGFLASGRGGEKYAVPLFFPLSYYVELAGNFLTSARAGSYTFLGFSAPVLPVFVYFLLKKKDSFEKVLFTICIICAVFLTFPVFGHIFNGFNYITNRWSFAIAFFLTLAFTKSLPQFFEEAKDKKNIFLILLVPCAMILAASVVSSKVRSHYLFAYAYLAVFLIIALVIIKKRPGLMKKIMLPAVFAGVLVGVVVRFSPWQLNSLTAAEKTGAYSAMLDDLDLVPESAKCDGDFTRLDWSQIPHQNLLILDDKVYGTANYWSENNSNLALLYSQLGIYNNYAMTFRGFDFRYSIQKLFNCSVFAKEAGMEPFNAVPTPDAPKKAGDLFYSFKTNLPFAYIYTQTEDYDKFLGYSPLEKQESLLYSAAIQNYDGKVNLQKSVGLKGLTKVKNYTVKADDGISFEDGKIEVKKAGAALTFFFESDADCETYACFKNIRYPEDPEEGVGFAVDFGNRIDYHRTREISNLFRMNSICNSGFHKKPLERIRITFDWKGTYVFDGFEIVEQNLIQTEEAIKAIGKNGNSHISVGENCVYGIIDAFEGGIASFSIPYSKNWTAYVDGLEQPLYQTNTAFLGLPLEKGRHQVKLLYHTPNLRLGILLSIIGWLIFIFSLTGICDKILRKVKKN